MDALPAVADPVIASTPRIRRAVALRRLGSSLAFVALAEVLGVVLVASVGDVRFTVGPDLPTIGFLASILLFPAVGALIIRQRPVNRVAWLMVTIGLNFGLGLLLFGYGVVGTRPDSPLPFALHLLIASQVFFVPVAGAATAVLLLVYPTDRLLGPRWRWCVVLAVLGATTYSLASLIDPAAAERASLPVFENPLAAPDSWAGAVGVALTIGNAFVTASILLGAASLVIRYRRSGLIEAAQIRWIALVGAVAAIAFVVAAFQVAPWSDAAFGLGLIALASMPIAIGFAISRYRLFDIDRLINRAIVYGSLTAILAGIFTAGIGVAQRLFVAMTKESSDAAIVATTLVVATVYAPLRKRLESLVDRWFKYEERRFGEYRTRIDELLSLLEPVHAAERLATAAVAECAATGGAVLDESGEAIATAGAWPVRPVVRLAVPGHTPLRALVLGPRSDGRAHDPRAIADVEEVVGLVARALRLPAGAASAGGAATAEGSASVG